MRKFWHSVSWLKPLVEVYDDNSGGNNRHHTMDENGVKAHQIGSQNRPRYPKNYYTCFEFFKMAVKILLIITGAGSFLKNIGAGIIKKKQKNTHAYQIMEELVGPRKKLYYGKEGMTTSMTRQASLPPPPPDDGEDDSKQRMEPRMTQEVSSPTIAAERPPEVGDEPKQPTCQQIQDEFFKKLADFFCKQVEDDSKQKPVRATPILVAAKTGVIEMVEKILEDIPEATLDLDPDKKNIVLLAAEHGHTHIYDHLLKSRVTQSLVGRVDGQGNNALHLAASFIHERHWIPGAAFQMQSEVKLYKYIEKSMKSGFFARYNNKGETAQEIFTKSHKDLIKEAREWFISTSQSSSVVAALVATVAYTSATSVPGGNNQNTGKPLFEGQPAFQIFAVSSLVALCFSVTALVFFLSIVTSRFHESDFATELPTKLFGGMTTLFVSIAANLVSFCAGDFYIIHNKLESRMYFLYAGLIFPVMAFFFTSQWRLYTDLMTARFFERPERPRWPQYF